MANDLWKVSGVGAARRNRWRVRDAELESTWPSLPLPTFVPVEAPGRARRRRGTLARRRNVQWSLVLITASSIGVGLYLLHAGWSATRVDVDVRGMNDGLETTSAALVGRPITLSIAPATRADRATFRVDGAAVDPDALKIDGPRLAWQPHRLPEGRHEVKLTVPRPLLGRATFRWRLNVDDTPPHIDVPRLLDPVAVCAPVTVRGAVEPKASLTLDGHPLPHNGTFALRYPRPPAAPLQFEAKDKAGNVSRAEVVVPVRYPGGQGVHVTAAAWGYEPLRQGILALIDAKRVSTVELDLKDEGGIIGYDSKLALPQRVGAVQPEYRLKETVDELKRRGVRVIGRIVAFRDPELARWAWDNGKRDWVIQAPDGKMFADYGGFTNHSNPEVHRYNIDIALEASAAGVDDILWDYVRRPEGDPQTMVVPGMRGTSADAVVEFLSTAHAALRERCVYQGASVFGIAADRPDAVGQDVPRIARHVDYVAPMVYPSHWVSGEYNVKNPNAQPFDIVRAALADFQAKMAGTGKYLVPWLQDFTLGYPYGRAEVRAQIDAAGKLGVPDWLLWNPGARYTTDALDPSLVQVRG